MFITFAQFVVSLGSYAKYYTPEQLKQLHIDAQKLATILLDIHRTRVSTQSAYTGLLPSYMSIIDRASTADNLKSMTEYKPYNKDVIDPSVKQALSSSEVGALLEEINQKLGLLAEGQDTIQQILNRVARGQDNLINRNG